MKSKINVGFIGTGFMGQLAHLHSYLNVPECEVTAIAEAKPRLAEAVASKHHIPTVYHDHRDLLADEKVDAVVCSQPQHHNYPLGMEALEAGKHLFTEKPMVTRLDDGQELVALAERRNLVYGVGFMKRYDPGVQLAREKLAGFFRSGELGELRMIDTYCFVGDWLQNPGQPIRAEDESEPPAYPRRYPDHVSEAHHTSYDSFINLYCHNINLVRFLLPERRLEVASVSMREHETFVAVLDAGDALVSLRGMHMRSRKWEEETHFLFERGKVIVLTPVPMNRQAVARVAIHRQADDDFQETTHHSEIEWAFLRQARGFVAAVQGETDYLAPGKDCLEDVRIMEDIFRKNL